VNTGGLGCCGGGLWGVSCGVFVVAWCPKESRRRARDSRAPPVEGGADGCDARALSAQPTAMKSLQIHELLLR